VALTRQRSGYTGLALSATVVVDPILIAENKKAEAEAAAAGDGEYEGEEQVPEEQVPAEEELPTSADEIDQLNAETEAGGPFQLCLFTFIPYPHYLILTCKPLYAHSCLTTLSQINLHFLSSQLKPRCATNCITTLKLSPV